MPSKRKWWSENWQSVVWSALLMMLTIGYSAGTLHEEFKSKINKDQAKEIASYVVIKEAFSLEEGVKLKAEAGYLIKSMDEIKDDVKSIKVEISRMATFAELKYKSRTTANKDLPFHNLAIVPLEGSGDENIPIKQLKEFRLTK